MNFSKIGAFIATVVLLGAFATVALAHDSNTLHKIGKAIQYTTRKDAENLSHTAHTTTNSRSVVRNRHTGNNFVVKPNGHKIFKSTTNPYVRRHHHLRYRRHHHVIIHKKK